MSQLYVKVGKKYTKVNVSEGSGYHSYTLYEKVGKKYVAVEEHLNYIDYLREGDYLVRVRPGSRSLTIRQYPQHSVTKELCAIEKSEAIGNVVKEYLAMRPTQRKVTKKQQKAWKDFEKAMGNDRWLIKYASLGELIDAVKKELLK